MRAAAARFVENHSTRTSLGAGSILRRDRKCRHQESGIGRRKPRLAKKCRSIRLAPELIVAPKGGRNEFGAWLRMTFLFLWIGIFVDRLGSCGPRLAGFVQDHSTRTSLGAGSILRRDRKCRHQESGIGRRKPRLAKKCRSIRLAPELIVAPKGGRNEFGCFAQDDTFVFMDRYFCG